jgi:hypothetical protein
MTLITLAAILLTQPPAAQAAELKSPPVVTPGEQPGVQPPPSDAVILFDGSSVSGWTTRDGKPAGWTVSDHILVCQPKTGDIVTAKTFGSAQIHVEFITPVEQGEGQDRGNSGVYLHGRYEVQVLDSYKSETYPDGQCAAIYKQHAPLVNACRPQGQWQTYDIIFHAPVFDSAGKKTANARATVLHNGVLVQDNAEIVGPTGGAIGQEERPVGPLLLQEHGHAVRYRNVWYRPL